MRKIFKEEQNLQIQGAVSLLVLAMAWCFQITRWEWIVIVLIVILVILAELANSVVERITDVLKPRLNGYVKEIKDIMAAGVLVASLTSIIVGLLIFLPHLSKFLDSFK